jgi:hypothetical protein
MQPQRKFNPMATNILSSTAKTITNKQIIDTDKRIIDTEWHPRTIASGDWDTAGKNQMVNHTEAKLEFIHNAIDNGANIITISKKKKLKAGSTVTQAILADIVPSHYRLTDAVKNECLWEFTFHNDGTGMTMDEMVENFGVQGNDKDTVRNDETIGHYKRGSVMAMETLNWDCGKYSCVITSIKKNTKSTLYVGSEGIRRGKVETVSPNAQEGTEIFLPCVAESKNNYAFLQEISAKLYPAYKTNNKLRVFYKTDSNTEELEFSDPLYQHLKGKNASIVHRSHHKAFEKDLNAIGVLSIDAVSFYSEVGSLGYDFAYYDRQRLSSATGKVIDFRKSGYYITFVNSKGREVTLACGYEHGGKFLSGQTDKAGLRVNIRLNKKAFKLFGISTNKSHVRIDWELMRQTAPFLLTQLNEASSMHISGSNRQNQPPTTQQINENTEIEKLLAKYLGQSISRAKEKLVSLSDENLVVNVVGKSIARNLISQPGGSLYSLTKFDQCLILNVNTATKHYDVYSKLAIEEKALMDSQYITVYYTCLQMQSLYQDVYDEEIMHEQLHQYQGELLRTIYKS